MKALRFVFPLAVFLGIAIFLFAGLGKDPRVLPSPLIDKPAPEFDLPDLHDPAARVSSKALRGQIYLLNVWGSWCVSCRIEHPVLEAFAREKLVPVIGLDWKDPREDALRWLAQFGDPYDQIAVDADGRTAIDFGIYGAPESFLVDAAGVIRFKHVGPLTPDVVEGKLKPMIAKLQGGKS